LGHPVLAGLLILLTIVAILVDAGFLPSLALDSCSWNATHVVLVKTTSNDGVFSVVKSWKGDVKPGDTLEVPGLKSDKDAVPISRYPKSGQSHFDSSGISERILRQPIGSQMILFLKRRQEGGSTSSSASIGKLEWEPANSWGGIQFSALWINGRKTFCFRQLSNPGPSALSECFQWLVLSSSDVAVLIARIEVVLRVQEDLAYAFALRNADVRANQLGRLALCDVYNARNEAMDALEKSGNVALPEVLQIMDQRPTYYDGDRLIRMFLGASGKDSGRPLHARLQQDVIYWKAIAPTLSPDWLDQLIEPGAPLFMKFEETKLLVQELDREHYTPAAATVAELHDFWVSQPLPYDPKWGDLDLRNGATGLDGIHDGLFGLAKKCDDFVKHVGVKKTDR
jgi:hypothetical protein